MFCPSCGASNESTSRFCVKCGHALPVAVQPEPGPRPQVAAQPQSRRASRLPLLAVGVLLVLAAVVVLPRLLGGVGLTDSPERAAREWIQAFMSGDASGVQRRTCSEIQKDVAASGGWGSAFAGVDSPACRGLQADLTGLNFTTSHRDANNAQVYVSGNYSFCSYGVTETEFMDSAWRMVREGGLWRWCGDWSE